jgi:hypothetical protein
VLFYGNQCRHYSVGNTDPLRTRVSLDLRAVRSDLFLPAYVAPAEAAGNKNKTGRAHFKLGQHYTSTAIERAWRAGRAGRASSPAQRAGLAEPAPL